MFSRKTTKISSPFSLQVDIFETGSCLSRWFSLPFLCIFDTRNPTMSISKFCMIQCAVFCSYCFSPILKFDPVEQTSVQFIFRSIIGIEASLTKFYLMLYLELRRFRIRHRWISSCIFSRVLVLNFINSSCTFACSYIPV